MASFDVYERELKLHDTFNRGSHSFELRKSISLHSATQNVHAYGESCPMPSYAGETYEASLEQLQRASEMTEVLDPQHPVEDFIADEFPCAQFALDTLRHDIQAQLQEKSIARLINSEAAAFVNIQLTHDDQSQQISDCPRVKYKVGSLSVEDDIQRITYLCQHINNKTQLRLDANGHWSKEQALQFCDSVKELPIDYIEDPCLKPEDMLDIKEHSSIPIAIDQLLNQSGTRTDIIKNDSFDIYIFKPMCFGSFDKLLAAMQKLNKRIIISDFFNGSIARCAARQLAAIVDTKQNEWHGLSGDELFVNDYHRMDLNDEYAYTIPEKGGLGCLNND